MLKAGADLNIFASEELVLEEVSLSSGGDTSISAQGRVLLENGELVSSGSVVHLVSDTDSSLDETDIIELAGELLIQATNGNVEMTAVSAEVGEDVTLDAQLVTLNGNLL